MDRQHGETGLLANESLHTEQTAQLARRCEHIGIGGLLPLKRMAHDLHLHLLVVGGNLLHSLAAPGESAEKAELVALTLAVLKVLCCTVKVSPRYGDSSHIYLQV